jgi:hypothetical protein
MSFVLALVLSTAFSAQADQDPLAALVEVLKVSDDDGFRLDILKGIRDGLKGRTTVSMPKGWSDVSAKLGQSSNAEVRSLAQMISITFGDPVALTALRKVLADGKAAADDRKAALESLRRCCWRCWRTPRSAGRRSAPWAPTKSRRRPPGSWPSTPPFRWSRSATR